MRMPEIIHNSMKMNVLSVNVKPMPDLGSAVGMVATMANSGPSHLPPPSSHNGHSLQPVLHSLRPLSQLFRTLRRGICQETLSSAPGQCALVTSTFSTNQITRMSKCPYTHLLAGCSRPAAPRRPRAAVKTGPLLGTGVISGYVSVPIVCWHSFLS